MGWIKWRRNRRIQETSAAVQVGAKGTPQRLRQESRSGHPVDEPWPADAGRPAWMVDGVQAALYTGDDELEVVGESFYQDELWSVVGRTDQSVRRDIHAVLVAEADNQYDANAISVWVNGLKVGHLSRADAAMLRPGLLKLLRQTRTPIGLRRAVVGGGPRADGRIGYLGVWLDYDRSDFGLASVELAPPPSAANLRTGLSVAVSSDLADDSYDLGWLRKLPENPTKRLAQLRNLLHKEVAPISRHYIMCELEAELYAFRDTFTSALVEYDEVTLQHDAEMANIRPALLTKFGKLPLLETYKQAAIRHSKARNLEQALRWVQRGLEVYGRDAHDDAWVADLQKREATLQGRIEKLDARSPMASAADFETRVSDVDAHSRRVSDSSVTEQLVCNTCGGQFERVRVGGRKPRNCPDCR